MKTARLDYPLPHELIATAPVEPRDACRLLVCSASDPNLVEHRLFRDLPDYLAPGDTLVFNTTSVLPARLSGYRTDSQGKVGGLFLGEVAQGLWQVMLRSNGKLRAGQRIALTDPSGIVRREIELIERAEEGWLVRLASAGPLSPVEVLRDIGGVPLPPYIDRARIDSGQDQLSPQDALWYQTVYADPSKAASIAAPTAGLHFTPDLLDRLAAMGVRRTDLVLHVGAGTFKPIEVEDLSQHQMHREFFEIPAAAAVALDQSRTQARRSIMVGTTAVRSAENLTTDTLPAAMKNGLSGSTDLFITPGYRFKWTDGLITNFHLPRSSLLALVGALFERDGHDGIARLLEIYRQAVQERYRFFSYGDAMLILP